MNALFILPSLFALSISKAVIPESSVVGIEFKEQKAASTSYAYAVDLDRPVSLAAFSCMKKAGYKTAIIRAYDPAGSGRFDVNAVSNIRNANQAGLGTEVFMTPLLRSSKKGSQQFRELYEGLKNGKINVKTVWLQVSLQYPCPDC
ncbi:unnamed protein product [Strongylus vulgaris]|uniref:Lysozyme n=1 Tax=Strongylus vulgaris TaxID=40348 RepID=A0A3P7JG63_STRVU|nr:unnamed protein product [Strongylus vulgaris]